MIEAIRHTFQDRCLLRIARLQETYLLAVAALPGDIDLIEVPVEVEVEEDLGPVVIPTPPVTDDNQQILDEAEVVTGQTFDVAVDEIEDLSESSGTDDKSVEVSSSEDSDDGSVPVRNKRTRKQSVLVGSVKKGKYSS